MQQAETVEVFSFRVFDIKAGNMHQSKYKAPRDVVANFGGEVLEGTAEHVARADLDEHGRYRRVAIGWGESR